MSTRHSWAVLMAALAGAVVQCGEKPPPPLVQRGPLNGEVARVGNISITPSLVSWVAGAKGASSRDALNDLVGDALAAQGASARGLDTELAVAWERTAALARRIPSHIAAEAAEQGAPSDDELSTVSVVHAVVLRSSTLRESDALAIARAIRQAVVGAPSADEFVKRANAVQHPHANVIAQPVGPFAADGVASGGSELDAGFVAAAFALRSPLELSPIISTPFGWHVLQLVERKPSDVSSQLEARKNELAGPVRNLRSRARLDALLRALRSSARVETAVAADELMARASALP